MRRRLRYFAPLVLCGAWFGCGGHSLRFDSNDVDGSSGVDGASSVDGDSGLGDDGGADATVAEGTFPVWQERRRNSMDGGGNVVDAGTDAGGDEVGGDGPAGADGSTNDSSGIADSGDASSDSSANALADSEGDAAQSADSPAASDGADESSLTDASDAGASAVDAAGGDASDGASGGEQAPDAAEAGNPADASSPADAGPPPPSGPPSVGITWASIANVYLELGATSLLINGYFTRLPGNDFYGGGSGLAYTHTNYSSDQTAINAVLTALGGPTHINWLFTGHSHWDHSFDTATWAKLTGAPIYGPRTTCFEVRAEGTPVAGCTVLVGGERLQLAPGVTVRAIRWNHSGDSTSVPEQHDPIELAAVPTPDAQGRLRAGVAEDFPNGGGSRAFLFTIASAAGPYSFFFEDSAGASDLNQPIVIDGVNYGAPYSNLAAALADASLTHVDLWIATGGAPVAELVVPLLHPKAYLPIHWDGLFGAFRAGAPVFSDSDLTTYLKTQNVQLITPAQYMDKWSLSPSGIVPVDNSQVKHALGF
jgi:hypothetical protein